MMEKEESFQNTQDREAGWEFTLPGSVTSPLIWLLLLLSGIALFLLFVLVNKVITYSNISTAVSSHVMPGGKMP